MNKPFDLTLHSNEDNNDLNCDTVYKDNTEHVLVTV